MDEPVVTYEGATTTDRRWLFADERGSIIASANASAVGLNRNSYDEYGVPGASNTGRFQYTGQTWLPEAGLYYYKARMYDPELGRFLQTDPIGYAAGANLYAYVGGDPVNFIDPSGMLQFIAYCTSGYSYAIGIDIITVGPSCTYSSFDGGGGGGGGGGGSAGGVPTSRSDADSARCEDLVSAASSISDVASGFGLGALGASAVGAGALLIPEPSISKIVSAAAFGTASGLSAVSLGLSVSSAALYGVATGDWGQAAILGITEGIDNSAFGHTPLGQVGSSLAGVLGGEAADALYGDPDCD